MVWKPLDIETLWFTELLEAIGQPNGLNCEHHKYLCTFAGIRSPGDRARRGVICLCPQAKSCGCFFFQFSCFFLQFSFQQSTAQCTCNRLIILTLTDHHCQLWLKKKLPSSPCDIISCSPSPPRATVIAGYQAEEQSTDSSSFITSPRVIVKHTRSARVIIVFDNFLYYLYLILYTGCSA